MPFGCRHKVLIFFLTANWGLLSATRGYIQALAMWPPPQDPLYFKSASSGRTPSPGLIKSGPLNKLTDLEPLKSLHLCHIALPNMIFRRRQWHPTPVLLPGKSHGRRSLVGCSPWGREESDTTERLHFHFSLSCIGEGNDNPLQCSFLENPREWGAWWAAVSGVAQRRTQLQ